MIEFWKNICMDDMREIDKKSSIVILPIGAIEQHAHHLPVGTDSMIMDGVIDRFVSIAAFPNKNVIIAPPIYVGKSNEHMDLCGTMSLSTNTMLGVVHDITQSIANSGFERILYLNTHGGNYHLLSILAQDMRIEFNISTFVMDWWFTSFWDDILKTEKESTSPYGVFHACELETSIIMALRPDLVKFDKLEDALPEHMFKEYKYISLFGPVGFGWKAQDISSTGAVGCSTLATPEKGEKFLDYGAHTLEKIIGECLTFEYIK